MIEPIMYDANISALEHEGELWRCFCYLEKLVKDSEPGSIFWNRYQKICLAENEQRKAQELGACFLLMQGLSAAGIDPMTEPVQIGDLGKPELADHRGVQFNLSHSSQHVLLALAPVGVGCDLQRTVAGRSRVAGRFFDKAEIAQLKSDDPEDVFFQIWTAKESYIKWLGLGMKKDLRSFFVDLKQRRIFDKEKNQWTAAIRQWKSPDYWTSVCVKIEESKRLEQIQRKKLRIEEWME